MKRLFELMTLAVLVFPCGKLLAQNPAVTEALKAKYGSAQWRTEYNGWYLVSYNRDGTDFYAFADRDGNVIASDAVKYKVFNGYIEMQLFDRLKKEEHDNWERKMQQYRMDCQTYVANKEAYDKAVATYDTDVRAAKTEAENRWRAARKRAYEIAVSKAISQNANHRAQSGGKYGILGTILKEVSGGVNVALAGETAANQVMYQPFEDQVMAERHLLTVPSEPHRPGPVEQAEPSDGYEWVRYPLLQPCPYTNLDYAALADASGVSRALKDGKYWGVVNSSLKEVIPCRYSGVARTGNSYIVCHDGKYGLLSSDGTEIIPCTYEKIEPSMGYMMCRKEGLWGVYTKNYEELYPCQFQEAEFLNYEDGLILQTKVRGLWGLIEFSSGTSLLPNSFSKIEAFDIDDTPAFKVFQEGRVGVYYTNGVLLLPCDFSDVSIAAVAGRKCLEVKKDGTVGLYDLDGATIIAPGKYDKYEHMGDFFVVEMDSLKGVCSQYGEELVPALYSSLQFNKDLHGFIVKKDGKCGVVDIRGQLAFPMVEAMDIEYDASMPGVMVIKNGYKENGALSADGTVIVEPKFKSDQIYDRVMAYQKRHDINLIAKEKLDAGYKLYDDYLTSQSVEKGRRETFSFYAQNYVERIINAWQKKGEFEKMSDWEARVNESTRQQKVYALTRVAQDHYINSNVRELPEDAPYIVGRYDPDNETYRVATGYADRPIFIHVPAMDAEEFKSSFSELKKNASFQVKNDCLALSEYTFTMPNGNAYKFKDEDELAYSIAQVDYNFESIDVENLAGKMSTSSIKFGTSDVDKNIPVTDKVKDKTFAVIIANENYLKEKNVEFAYNDGMAFKDYCVKAMGIPATNVHFKPNASLNDMRFEFNWIKKVAEEYKGEAGFIVYYAGHGLPDDASAEAYMLPVDGNGEDLESAYKLSKLYDMLGEIPTKEVMVFMDACFSGSQRNGEVLASARGVAIRPRIAAPTGHVVVYSAVTDKETAFPYKDKIHGLFTYYLLKKIQSTQGELDLGTLSDYVSEEVARKSIVVNSKSQHPTINVSPSISDNWRQFNIK